MSPPILEGKQARVFSTAMGEDTCSSDPCMTHSTFFSLYPSAGLRTTWTTRPCRGIVLANVDCRDNGSELVSDGEFDMFGSGAELACLIGDADMTLHPLMGSGEKRSEGSTIGLFF